MPSWRSRSRSSHIDYFNVKYNAQKIDDLWLSFFSHLFEMAKLLGLEQVWFCLDAVLQVQAGFDLWVYGAALQTTDVTVFFVVSGQVH